MTVGVLIVTHGRVGEVLLNTAVHLLGFCPLQVSTLSVEFDCNLDEAEAEARSAARALDSGDGVLVLTDVYGSTPSNVANRVQGLSAMAVVAGLNLPMLIRVLNYPRLDLEQLAAKAVSGGRDGVLLCTAPPQTQERTG